MLLLLLLQKQCSFVVYEVKIVDCDGILNKLLTVC